MPDKKHGGGPLLPPVYFLFCLVGEILLHFYWPIRTVIPAEEGNPIRPSYQGRCSVPVVHKSSSISGALSCIEHPGALGGASSIDSGNIVIYAEYMEIRSRSGSTNPQIGGEGGAAFYVQPATGGQTHRSIRLGIRHIPPDPTPIRVIIHGESSGPI